MENCLSSADVAEFLGGDLSESGKAAAHAHLAECAACRRVVEQQRSDEDFFQEIRLACYDDPVAGRGVAERHDPDIESEPTLHALPAELEGYQVLSEIHRGGQGIVYRAIQSATKRQVALKVLLAGQHASPRTQRRFEREIDLVASLQHPNIVTIYDSGVRNGQRFFAT